MEKLSLKNERFHYVLSCIMWISFIAIYICGCFESKLTDPNISEDAKFMCCVLILVAYLVPLALTGEISKTQKIFLFTVGFLFTLVIGKYTAMLYLFLNMAHIYLAQHEPLKQS